MRSSKTLMLERVLAELKECSISGNIRRGRVLHEAAVLSGEASSLSIGNALIHMYGKCGSLRDAHKVFEGLERRSVVSWTSMILGYAENGEEENALVMFTKMNQEGCTPTTVTFMAAVKAASKLAVKEGNVVYRERGKSLHLLASVNGCTLDIVVENALIDMYAKFGMIDFSCSVFSMMKDHDVVSWTTLMFGYADNGNSSVSLELLAMMRVEGCLPNPRTFVAALRACNFLEEAMTLGKAVHLLASQSGCDSELYVQTTLVDMYGKYGDLDAAQRVFDSIIDPNVVCWNALILGYADAGECDSAWDLLLRMRAEGCHPDERTFLSALRACIESAEEDRSLPRGRILHLLALKAGLDDVYVNNTLVDMYAKFNRMDIAQRVFDSMVYTNAVSRTVLIMGYVDNGDHHTALDLFVRINREGYIPVSETFVAVLKVASPEQAKALHCLASGHGCDLDMYVNGTLVDLYAKSGSMTDARRVFDSIKLPDTVSWNSLILGYADNGEPEMSLHLFSKMGGERYTPSTATFVAALEACSNIVENVSFQKTSQKRGNMLLILATRCGFGSDMLFNSSLLTFYAKCQNMEEALRLFESLSSPNALCWSALITGYAENEETARALNLFRKMKREGHEPNKKALVAALKACCSLGTLDFGKEIHADISNCGFEHDILLSNCLVDFYAKCGSLLEAKHVFDTRLTKNLITWTTLITAYSGHGETTGLFDLFGKMLDDNVQPNAVTFLCVLKGCSHAGLVEKGKDYFVSMKMKYGIDPDIEHFTCMIDILGRSNKLDDAMAMVRSMPYSPDPVTWRSVQGACQKWRNVRLGQLAFDCLMSLDGRYSGNYILMSNIDRS